MNHKITFLPGVLMISLVLGFQPGAPKIIAPVAFAAGSSTGTAPVVADTQKLSIDTTPYWNGKDYVDFFGIPDTATYGQTITMVKDAALIRFSFFIKISPDAVFRGYVFAWDGTKASGDPLFESAPVSTTQSANFEEIVFTPPSGTELKAGQQYVLFASASKDVQPSSAGVWGVVNNVYQQGQFVYLNNSKDSSKWTNTAWENSLLNKDLAFKATFAEVMVAPATLTIPRPDESGVFTISLTSQPAATVTIPLTSTGGCSVPASVEIPPLEWQTGVTVTVSKIKDRLIGPQSCQVQLLPSVSSDTSYLDIDPDDVSATVNYDYGIFFPLLIKAE